MLMGEIGPPLGYLQGKYNGISATIRSVQTIGVREAAHAVVTVRANVLEQFWPRDH